MQQYEDMYLPKARELQNHLTVGYCTNFQFLRCFVIEQGGMTIFQTSSPCQFQSAIYFNPHIYIYVCTHISYCVYINGFFNTCLCKSVINVYKCTSRKVQITETRLLGGKLTLLAWQKGPSSGPRCPKNTTEVETMYLNLRISSTYSL